MTTKVKLFLSMKDEGVARSLGARRLRRTPHHGQEFSIPIDGRSVHARITRCATDDAVAGPAVTSVYAEEI